jgi:diguanylate cyclase (GGDEF)-like protein/PAS domain S-box-containing protein
MKEPTLPGGKNAGLLQALDEATAKLLLDSLHDGIYLADKEGKILFWNKEAEAITGHPEREAMGQTCSDILAHIDDQGKILCTEDCPVQQTLKDGMSRDLEAYLLHRDGYRLPISLRVIPLRDQEGRIAGAAQIFLDVSPKLAMPPGIEDLNRRELLDPLTETGNQQFLKIALDSRLEEMRKFHLSFGFLYVDIDHFSQVTESYGKEMGQKIIRMVAKTLQSNLRFTDIVGRWGADKFLVILLNVDEAKLSVVGNKLRLLVQSSYLPLETETLSVTVSMGGVVAKKRESSSELMGRAEKLMLHSKWLGRNRVSLRFEGQ